MIKTRPIIDQLTRKLTLIGVVGGTLLIAVLVIGSDAWSERQPGLVRGWGDVAELVLYEIFFFALTIGAIVVAARRVVKQALAPLHDSVHQIEDAIAANRGFRLNLDELPVEVVSYGQAINRLIDQLERLASEREAFAAAVAHELKNPMAVLLLELDVIGTDETRRLMGDVRQMSRLIDQLLIMAQLEAHATVPVKKTSLVNLADLAGELVETMAPAAIEEGRQIALTINDHHLTRGRRELISAAIRNMLENALRVTPRHGLVMLTVGPGARIVVSDGGPGLAKDELKRLSRPFAQARHPSAHGAGLGLAIIHQVARLHDGSLDCDPEAREIILTLPSKKRARAR